MHASLRSLTLVAFLSAIGCGPPTGTDDARCPVEIVAVDGQPVRVLDCEPFDSHGITQLRVTIANDTDRSVRFAGFQLGAAGCREAMPRFLLAYGDGSVLSADSRGGELPLEAGATAIAVYHGDVNDLLDMQRRPGCPDDRGPFLVPRYVAFCDGTGWEAAESEPDAQDWSGREWEGAYLVPCGEPTPIEARFAAEGLNYPIHADAAPTGAADGADAFVRRAWSAFLGDAPMKFARARCPDAEAIAFRSPTAMDADGERLLAVTVRCFARESLADGFTPNDDGRFWVYERTARFEETADGEVRFRGWADEPPVTPR